MFCPRCGAKYREGFTQCWDCGAALTEQPSPEPAGTVYDDTDLVEVYRAAGAFEGRFIKSVLEGSGIECVLSGATEGGAYHVNVGPLGVVRVLVRDGDSTDAERLIAAAAAGDLEIEEE